MGFLDALFGGGKKLKGPAPDRIFAMVTAQITMETGLGLKHKNAAGIVFEDEQGKPVYFIYNFKRGKYYPFVPAPGTQARNTEREFQLKAQLENELPIEPELERWFPLWEIPL